MATIFSVTRDGTVGGKNQNSAAEQDTSSGYGARTRRVLLGVGLLGAPLIVGLAGPATAQETQTQEKEVCTTIAFDESHLLNPNAPRTAIVPIDLPAGVISINDAHSWDGYPSRVDVVQLSEIWEVEFIAADGSVVSTSAPTEDVEDFVAEGHWYGSLGQLTLPAPVVGIRAHHRPDLFDDASVNSVYAAEVTICRSAEVPPPEPPTTTPPTTEPPEPTTTAPGDTCPLGSDGNPIESDNPNCPVPVTTTTPEPPPPSGPTTDVACPLDGDGNPVDPSDPDCPQPTTTTVVPTTPPPPKGPSLPVTGSESTLLLLSGLWMLGAGSTMVAYSRTR